MARRSNVVKSSVSFLLRESSTSTLLLISTFTLETAVGIQTSIAKAQRRKEIKFLTLDLGD